MADLDFPSTCIQPGFRVIPGRCSVSASPESGRAGARQTYPRSPETFELIYRPAMRTDVAQMNLIHDQTSGVRLMNFRRPDTGVAVDVAFAGPAEFNTTHTSPEQWTMRVLLEEAH